MNTKLGVNFRSMYCFVRNLKLARKLNDDNHNRRHSSCLKDTFCPRIAIVET